MRGRAGRPKRTIIHGRAMGGHVAVAALELHPGVYQGGLIECGAVDGVGLIDWLYAYAAAAEYLSDVRLFDAPDRAVFDALVKGRWLHAMGMPGSYTERGRRFDCVVTHLMGGDLPLRLDGLKPRFIMNLNPRDPGPQHEQELARHASTTHVRYRIDSGLGVDEETPNREARPTLYADAASRRPGAKMTPSARSGHWRSPR